jgi:hypothetical protein
MDSHGDTEARGKSLIGLIGLIARAPGYSFHHPCLIFFGSPPCLRFPVPLCLREKHFFRGTGE